MCDNLKAEVGAVKFAQINKDDLYEMIRDEGQGYNIYIFEKNQTPTEICKNDKSFEIDFDAYLEALMVKPKIYLMWMRLRVKNSLILKA